MNEGNDGQLKKTPDFYVKFSSYHSKCLENSVARLAFCILMLDKGFLNIH